MTIGDATYQVVARLYYEDLYRERVRGVFGFMVDLAWAREHYFPEITRQMFRVTDASSRLSMTLLDSRDALIARNQTDAAPTPGLSASTRRSFERVFFDPRIVAIERPPDLPREEWIAEVSAFPDPPLATAILQARRTLVLAALASIALAFGLALTVRALRASARFAELRSEFVSTVTHELKAPIGTMRVIGETLVGGRVDIAETRRDYGQLIVQEAKRLTLLVDNLLALSRVADVTEMYSLDKLSVRDLMLSVLQQFKHQLELGGFTVTTDVPADLPPVSADPGAMQLALDNILYNAIRYSDQVCAIDVRASADAHYVRIVIADRGRGIPADEIALVTRRFFRGRGAAAQGGSGLGLAIAQRIIADHGGQLEIRSEVGRGTEVGIFLPIAV
jgi:signal transduction histidine kinase